MNAIRSDIRKALDSCKDAKLFVAMNLAVACSLVRRKEDTENRNNRTATRTVSKTINGAAISFNISLISLAPFYLSTYILPCRRRGNNVADG